MDSLNRHEDYGQESLDETHLVSDPIEQFKQWLLDAEAANIYEPNAFVLGTVDSDEYFASRPHESQVAAWSSHQSQPIEN